MKQYWNVPGWVNVGFKFLRLEWVLFDHQIQPVQLEFGFVLSLKPGLVECVCGFKGSDLCIIARLDPTHWRLCLTLAFSFFSFFFSAVVVGFFLVNSTPVHCSRDQQTPFFSNFLIKNRSHGTIHIFKNYFTTMFSVFNKISYIETDPYLKLVEENLGMYIWSCHNLHVTLRK